MFDIGDIIMAVVAGAYYNKPRYIGNYYLILDKNKNNFLVLDFSTGQIINILIVNPEKWKKVA